MNRMSWAATLLVMVSGTALGQQPQPHRDMHDDYWIPVVHGNGGVPGVYLGSAGADWAQRIDFASASGGLQPVSWSPATGRADFDDLPRPALLPSGDEPFGQLPRGGDTGAALAGNIRVEEGLSNLTEVLAVPEPSALLMMLAGVGAIAFVIRRRINDS